MQVLDYDYKKGEIVCKISGLPFGNPKILDLSFLDNMYIQKILNRIFELPLEMIILRDEAFVKTFLEKTSSKIDLRNCFYKDKFYLNKIYMKNFYKNKFTKKDDRLLLFYCDKCQANIFKESPSFCPSCEKLKCEDCKCCVHFQVYDFPMTERMGSLIQEISFLLKTSGDLQNQVFELIKTIPDEYIINFCYADFLNKIVFPEFRNLSFEQIKFGVLKCLKKTIGNLFDYKGEPRDWWCVFKVLRTYYYRNKIISFLKK